MEIPWVQIVIAALTSSAFTTGMLAMLLFGGKSLIERWLARNLEKFKVDLQLAAFEHQTRFTKLHEKRAEVIAELYNRLVRLQGSLYSMLYALERENSVSSSEVDDAVDKAGRAFSDYFKEHLPS